VIVERRSVHPQLIIRSARTFKMLTDGKIDSLDTHLEQFKLNNATAQDDMQVSAHITTELLSQSY
jgi:hypothetical protein